jgi:hypothetical protein
VHIPTLNAGLLTLNCRDRGSGIVSSSAAAFDYAAEDTLLTRWRAAIDLVRGTHS